VESSVSTSMEKACTGSRAFLGWRVRDLNPKGSADWYRGGSGRHPPILRLCGRGGLMVAALGGVGH
jgi:hypothetical protein